MSTLLRHWTLLQRIPRYPRHVTTVALMEHLQQHGFAVTLRTVQRDLLDLSSSFSLTCDEGRPARWYWTPDAPQLSLPGMDPLVALAFRLSDLFLQKLLPPTVRASLAPYRDSAERVLEAVPDNPLSRWPARVRVLPRGQPLEAPPIATAVLEAVYEAVLKGRCLQAHYTPRSTGQARVYRLHPLGLVVRDQVIYLVGRPEPHEEARQFALHRFEQAEVLHEPLRPPAGFNLDAYIAERQFDLPSGAAIALCLRCGRLLAEHLREMPLSADQTLTEEDGGRCTVTATVADTQQLRWWLQGFADQVEVRAPATLRAEFAATAQRLLTLYG